MQSLEQRQGQRITVVLVAVVALLAVLVIIVGSAGQNSDPADTRSCAELLRSFNVASASVQRFDRGTPQFETAEDAKWAAYDQSRALDCGNF